MSQVISKDAFLGGRIEASQPCDGYRSGTDAVLLAAAVPDGICGAVLELGCGAGVSSLCLGARLQEMQITGLEIQPRYAELARLNAKANGIALTVCEGSVAEMPADLRERTFDVVMANPPYFETERMTPPRNEAKETAHLAPQDTLSLWIKSGVRRLKPLGTLVMIMKPAQLVEAIVTVSAKCGKIEIIPIMSRPDRAASRCILRATKGSRAETVLLPPLIMHARASHAEDSGRFAERAERILRHGAAL